jgi:hypothetical protein
MKTKIVISKDTANMAARELTKLFPKLDKEPEYSVGYQRWVKLSKREQQAIMILHKFDRDAVMAWLEAL